MNKSIFEMTDGEAKYNRLLSEANEAKNRLWGIARELDLLGYSRKANSCRTLVEKIEEWQNRG